MPWKNKNKSLVFIVDIDYHSSVAVAAHRNTDKFLVSLTDSVQGNFLLASFTCPHRLSPSPIPVNGDGAIVPASDCPVFLLRQDRSCPINSPPMLTFKTIALFLFTALAEIAGCYLPYLWLREGKSIALLIPAALSLGLFAWLLTLHPTAAGRVYAAYGGVYITVAILWLWLVDGIRPSYWDMLGSLVALAGMAIILFAPRTVA